MGNIFFSASRAEFNAGESSGRYRPNPEDEQNNEEHAINRTARRRWAAPIDRQAVDEIVRTVNLLERTMSKETKQSHTPDSDSIPPDQLQAKVACPYCHQMVSKRFVMRHMRKCYHSPDYNNDDHPEPVVECPLCFRKVPRDAYERHLKKCSKAIAEWKDI